MNPTRSLLVVEDDAVLRRHLKMLLEAEGYSVTDCETLAEARVITSQKNNILACVVDWSLPDGEGAELISELRAKESMIPMLLLTARSALSDKVMGLKLGATDYIVKPFEPLELLARLDRHITFYEKMNHKERGVIYKAGDISIDEIHHRAFWRQSPVELTRLQFSLLVFLIRSPGKVFSRDDLLNEVWGIDKYPTTRTVDNHIVQLRQKFAAEYFVTVHGYGYKFEVPVKHCHE